MINLLPPTMQREYRDARQNSRLMHWITLLGLGILGMVIITGAGVFYIRELAKNYNSQAAITEERLQKRDLEGTQKQVADMSNNIKLAIEVLSREVLFSKLLIQLATVTPSKVILGDLNIGEVGGTLSLIGRAADYQSATQFHANLSDPKNKIFEKTDIVSISCLKDSGNVDPAHPCKFTFNALFGKDSQFLLINDQKAKNP